MARVLDGRSRSVRSVPVPHCTAVEQPGQPAVRAELAAVGGGQLLWACLQHASRAYPLTQPVDGSSPAAAIPGFGPGWRDQAYELTFNGIGRCYWVSALEGNSRGTTTPVYVPLGGGQRHGSSDNSPSSVTDLNAPNLQRTMCEAIRRPPGLEVAFAYRHPFAMTQVDRRPLRSIWSSPGSVDTV